MNNAQGPPKYPACGANNRPEANFCDTCGARLKQGTCFPPVPSPPPPRSPPIMDDFLSLRRSIMNELKALYEKRKAQSKDFVIIQESDVPNPPAPSRGQPPPLRPQPITAYLLVRAVPAALNALLVILRARGEITEARAVSGDWDVVARVEALGLDQLGDLVLSIRREPAVQETCTLITLKGRDGRDPMGAYPLIPPPPPPSKTAKRQPMTTHKRERLGATPS